MLNPPPLLAFGIANLPMLGWLAVAVAPILIHLWSRRKYRQMSWAAMEYLLAAVQRQTRRLLLEQWLLLAIRTLLVVLVVLAVAEPYVAQSGLASAPGGHTHRVLVVDGSYSMAYKPTDQTRFQRAKELARQIVEQSPQGDAFTLIVMSSPPRVVVGTPALQPSMILGEIDRLEFSHTSADLPATIKAIRRVVDVAGRGPPRLERHEVYFLTDLQRITWAPKLSEAAAGEFLRGSSELAETANLVVIDLGQPQAENLAITNLRAVDPLMIMGRNVQLEVELKNFGRQACDHQPVEFLVDGRRVEWKQIDVPPEATATVDFAYRFDEAADHAIEVRAAGDALDVDNHRFLAAPARQSIRALCVNGRPSGTPFGGAADYLAVALTPEGQPADHALVQAEVVPESALLERNLHGYDCVFLCNVAQFTASEARAMDDYLQGGGSLIFFLGDQVLADRYNAELGPTGQDRAGGPRILPAQIGPLVDQLETRLDPLDYRHPIVQPFRGRGEAGLLTTPVYKHWKLELPESSPAKTVLATGNGDPLVVEEPIGRGRVVLVATSADPSWTAMPLWPSFVPLVQEIVAWCAGGQLQRQNLTVGEPLEAAISLSEGDAPLVIQSPDGRRHAVELRAAGEHSILKYADTAQSGIYVARFGPPIDRSQIFAVNVDTAESDLTPIDPDELRNEVWPGVPFVHQTTWQDLGEAAPSGPMLGRSRLHIDLLYVVLGLLFVETFLSWKLGYHGKDEG
jgi:hypothetical protein